MAVRVNLREDPAQGMQRVLTSIAQSARQTKTGPTGNVDLGEDGDLSWPSTDKQGAPVTKSVKRFAVELDDTTELAAQLEQDLAAAAAQLATAEANLATLRDVTLPAMRTELDAADTAAQTALGALDGRLEDAETTLTAAQGDITAMQSLLEGTDLEQLQIDLQAALADITAFQTETMPALEARLQDAEDLLAQLEGTDISDLQTRLGAAETAVSDLQTTTLPALEASLDARITQGQQETAAALAVASGDISTAQSAIDAARARLDAHDVSITGQAEVLDLVAKQATRGQLPPRGAPLGAHWITPEGRIYVRVPCEEVA
ncbi:hypothetical protein GCM10009592_28780 [Brachybacterium rhamnosum]|uniref:Chromosome segregation ATPase n=1 Tax=Brachybacterium rhamnosum TaxID=173361 RepID=A0ABW4Q021_9MICO